MSDQSPVPNSGRLKAVLDQPLVGFLPWIALSVVEGPHRVVLAAAIAFGLAALSCATGALLGLRPKVLDLTAIGCFAVLIAVAAAADAGTSKWLGVWAGELSNVVIAAVAGISLAVRRPFTLQYARETTERSYWDTPLFLRINFVITAVWAVAFLVVAVVGYIGDGPLHEPDNVWTNWIIQIAVVVLAIKFTAWYPGHATGDEQPRSTPRPVEARHGAVLLRPVAVYLVPVGIFVLIVSNKYWWVGVVLIVAGVVLARRLRSVARGGATVEPRRPS